MTQVNHKEKRLNSDVQETDLISAESQHTLDDTKRKAIEAFDINAYLKQLTERPGVYRMYNAEGKIIYVGKAKNLKRRVSSYFKKSHDEIKTSRMVTQIAYIEVTITDTESEALILENTLIKRYKPKYNILFRDDKSYPYIFVSTAKAFPSLSYHRGAKRRVGKYYGPFPNAAAVHQTLQALQKIFPVRQCAESVFNHRSRPCLQYQIKRCSGPCVDGLVTKQEYDEDVRHTLMFLEGKSFDVIEELGHKMEQASEALEFELAAAYRDKISALRAIQSQHLINQPGSKDMDVLAISEQASQVCVCLMMYRGGNLWGSEHFFPKQVERLGESADADAVLSAFIAQHYEAHPVPAILLLPMKLSEHSLLQKWLTDKRGSQVKLQHPVQQTAKGLVQLAETNAITSLKQHLGQKATQQERLVALQEALALSRMPEHMECFDISHTQGAHTVASCVVFTDGVPNTQLYRKFNIEGIQPGDDYAAMHQALSRRYSRIKKEGGALPDLIVVDGGKGQLNQAIEVLKTLELESVPLVSVAKGEGRKAGLEILYTPYNEEGIDLEADDIALHLINHIRDEAHRFAITSHRTRRGKAQTKSALEEIEGIGPKTRKSLLLHFGGLNEVKDASVNELSKVKGVSLDKAQKIYDFFHGSA
ncbi:excinuclease ABC subunit UvrC [Thiomicrorhabdus sp. zzn3]|uniref:excinuclease ABC subunit UvrC n=1 Tax=Thiomicrorhabdus sp. zzn3 TaxID=3039775 RepID=UPI00243678A1|nr:excinuclease ABC subunit UvrC [Thiomicrorhabdus sp. zzn3]MDG6777904.1 excinuclease ABC subunit UvrC [Thiomicrorhabdus sp. zzn3]